MPKNGIKIKELAKEIGITSRELINRCRVEGVPVQNSITRMKPDIEKQIRSWFENSSESRQ